MFCHIFQTLHIHCLHCRLVAIRPVHCRQISVELSVGDNLRSSGPITDRRDDALWDGGVVWFELEPHHVPAAPSRHQLESGKVRAMFLVVLHRELRQFFV